MRRKCQRYIQWTALSFSSIPAIASWGKWAREGKIGATHLVMTTVTLESEPLIGSIELKKNYGNTSQILSSGNFWLMTKGFEEEEEEEVLSI